MTVRQNSLSKPETGLTLAITTAMMVLFTWLGGLPLIVTFDVGLVGVALVIWALFLRRVSLPEPVAYLPIYLGTLAWQFIHFTEEFFTGFREKFPQLYGTAPYSERFFVAINMGSYAVFIIACLAVLIGKRRFLVAPMLFFVIYGAIGNAIAHTWWVIWLGGYFPGFYTAQLYWILGPLALARLIGSMRWALLFTMGFAAVLIPALTLAMR